jgi:hypothetical protein
MNAKKGTQTFPRERERATLYRGDINSVHITPTSVRPYGNFRDKNVFRQTASPHYEPMSYCSKDA